METLKFLLWNVEWMNDLFDAAGNFHPDTHIPVHNRDTTVKERREHLSGVINELSPDLIVVVEGPNREQELQLFFDTDVTGTWEVRLQPTSGSTQCIGCAVRTDLSRFDPTTPVKLFNTEQMTEFKPFEFANENDGIVEKYRFERSPLYIEVKTLNGEIFRVMGLHLKSKGIFDAYEWSKWWAVADGNRKKILAQTRQIRRAFLDKYLGDVTTQKIPLIVCGDINDGPGMDASEKRLLGSGVEQLMGNVWKPFLCLGNSLFDTLSEKNQENLNFASIYTTSFKDPIFNNVWQKEWIDHILYSFRSANWVVNAKVNIEMPDGQKIYTKYKHASDHMPVSVDVVL